SLTVVRRHSEIGTILFGLDVDPTNGDVWIGNTEARNLIAFEPVLRGHLVDHRLTRLTTGATPSITIHDLNPAIDYGTLPNPSALATALAQPTDVAFAPSGDELFVAAFGTDRIGVVDPANGAVVARVEIGDAASAREKRGPRGLAHHPTQGVLYVLNRLSNTLSVVDTALRTELLERKLVVDPTPLAIKEGRGFLYDAKLSGNGTASCAVCHIDTTTDNLAWNLGDPGGELIPIPGPLGGQFHPMKGPMTTQSLVGIENQTPFHWRGDRTDFAAFNPAFDKLLGGSELATADMDAFTTFIDSVEYPPNPNQNRDRTFKSTPVGASADEGRVFFTSTPFNAGLLCVNCHSLGTGTNNTVIPGLILQEPQSFKVPQLRNLYKRDGRRNVSGQRTAGFGQLHDGSDDDVFDLLSAAVFGPLSTNSTNKTKLMAFVESFDTGMAPAVGFSRTFDATNYQNSGAIADRALLMAQAQAFQCDVVAVGEIDGREQGLVYNRSNQQWRRDRLADADVTTAALDALFAQGDAKLTFLGVPLGHGTRIGVDRDGDGIRDGDEGLETYGATTPGCTHELRISSPAFRGNDLFGFVTEGATPGSNAALFLGFGPASIPFLGIDVLVDPNGLISVPTSADARGVATLPMELGDDVGLAGVQLFAQMVFLDSCGSFGIAATGAVHVTIQ
ncbi:MAG: beta-propeller fold lactonase family protein, partial [Planctomycetes bacterium]|nr:beta-propeller fold lactonase family protein [Planctomycetota bacterium]